MSDNTDALRKEAFFKPSLNLRPISIGILTWLAESGYDLESKNPVVRVNTLMALAWALSTDLDEVLDAIATGKDKKAVTKFAFNFPINNMKDLETEFIAVSKQIYAAGFEVAPSEDSTPGK